MTWRLPRTWSTGDQLSGDTTSSGSLNLQLRDELISLRGMNEYAQRMSLTANQTLNTGVYTAINWKTITWEAGSTGLHNTGSGTKLTAPLAGIYELAGAIEWVGSTVVSYRGTAYRENGTSSFHISTLTMANNTQPGNMPFGAIVKLTTADYIEVMGFQNTGGNLAIHGGTVDRSHCTWRLLGAAS